MKNNKQKLLCVDFEFQKEIYNKIWERNKHIDVAIINRADMALELMATISFDFLLTTIVMPGELDGLKFIDEVQNNSEKYGNPEIAVITGLGGDNFHNEVEKRNVKLIDRYERQIKDIEQDIDIFLKQMVHENIHQYPTEHILDSINNIELQKEDKLPGILKEHTYTRCSKCNSENLNWIRFRSPKETWDMLCGRDSWLLICMNCKNQLEEVPISMS